MLIPNEFRCVLMGSDEFWWVLIGFDGFWWVLMGSDGFWCLLMGSDRFWWVLMGVDGFWWVWMGSDAFWWVLMDPVGSWCEPWVIMASIGLIETSKTSKQLNMTSIRTKWWSNSTSWKSNISKVVAMKIFDYFRKSCRFDDIILALFYVRFLD